MENRDPSLEILLMITDHVFRRYVLPLVLLAATVLRYNVFSLVYFLLFMVGFVITGPRQWLRRVPCIVYLGSVLIFSVLFIVLQFFFQISLMTGPVLEYCETSEVIFRQIGLIQFTVPLKDSLRHIFLDVIVVMVSSVSVGVAIKVSRLNNSASQLPTTRTPTMSSSSSESSTLNVSSIGGSNTLQHYVELPSWAVSVLDISLFFLFLLSGVAVPSILSFWYFFVFLLLAIMWSVHYKHAGLVVRSLRTISLIYTAVHLIVLYLYQFQSFQLAAPSTSFGSLKHLVVRLFGLTPIIKTTCGYSAGLSFWSDIPILYFVNPFALIALFLTLGIESQLWLATPNMFWSVYVTYYVPWITSSSDSTAHLPLKPTDAQHYGSITDPSMTFEEVEPHVMDHRRAKSSKDNKKRSSTFRKRIIHFVTELWKTLMSVSYVFSLVAMMVWSVLYPSWPGLVLLLWAVGIWVIPRVNPKQSLQYSSPFLVIYAIGLLVVSFINALPITHEGFTWDFKVELSCKYSTRNIEDCLSTALGAKCLLSLAFFASLRQLIRKTKKKHFSHREEDQILATENEDGTVSVTGRLYTEIYSILVSYWIVAVMAAFLLVILVGQPSAFKTVYLVFLFIFFLFYQLFQKWWVIASYPIWWLLVVYGAIHLVLVYTFQFEDIKEVWYQTFDKYNTTYYYSPEDIFTSIGFETNSKTTAKELFNLLVPLAIFIAVIALHVRYFSPIKTSPSNSSTTPNDPLTVTQVLTELTPGGPFNEMELENIEKDLVRREQERRERRSQSTGSGIEEFIGSQDALVLISDNRREDTPTKSTPSYRILVYILFNIRQFLSASWILFWRFSELHTNKLVIIAIFAYGLYELSFSYIIVILCGLLSCPLPVLNHVMYPLLTVYLGVLSFGKYIYQFPVILIFDFGAICNSSNLSATNITGMNYSSYTFSPQSSGSSWFGLNQTTQVHSYVGGVIAIALLICFWYSSRRHQGCLYSSGRAVVEDWEVRSLFIGLDYECIQNSVEISVKFFINHSFDLFGLEICLLFEAILVAVRIDVYGVLYATILGLMLLLPRSLLPKIWPVIVITHGILLAVQYGLLVGIPLSAICRQNGYPWDSVLPDSIIRWLYLPRAGGNTLDKYLLYGDLLTYMMICFQARNFVFNPVSQIINDLPINFGKVNWFKFIKVQTLKNSFWVALFLLFASASSRLSFLGLLCLVVCFIFLYHGPKLLIDSRRTRKKWWSFLRLFVWLVMLSRNVIQFIGCAIINNIFHSIKGDGFCFIVSVFDIRCVRPTYYGIKDEELCINGTEGGTGLWLDLIAFACITIQIVVMDSLYIELIRGMEIRSIRNAQRFFEVRQQFMDDRKKIAEIKEAENIKKLHQREVELRSRVGRIDMLLYAGVSVPPEYISQKETTYLASVSDSEEAYMPSDEEGISHDGVYDDTPLDEEHEGTPLSSYDQSAMHSSLGFKKFMLILYYLWLEAVDVTIRWLEDSCADYVHAVVKLRRFENDGLEEISIDPESFTSSHTFDDDGTHEPIRNRFKRFFFGLYYCFLSHFDYFVFLIIIVVIVTVGTLTSLIYAALLFFWGVLSPRTPSKWFWQAIMGYTMFVMLIKYIYSFAVLVMLNNVDKELNQAAFAASTITLYNILGWIFGNEKDGGYFGLSLANLLLLIFLMIHRGLLKQQGLWRSNSLKNPIRNLLSVLKGKTKELRDPLPPYNCRKDYYVVSLICDILCFITIIFGYSEFAVTTDSDKGVLQAASYIQSNQIPIPFLLMLLFQFISMVIDRAIYICRARFIKIIFYIFLLITWNIGLLIVIPAITQRAFSTNLAAQFAYFFKSLYFILSGCQIVSGYPSKRLRYFISSSYSSINGIVFMCYRSIPLLSEMREVIDWMFTDSTLSFRQWLRVQEIWAMVYLVKVRRMREQTFFSRNIGEKFNSVLKYLQGSCFVFALLLLIWGPLVLMSLINETSIAHPPVLATISLNLEGSELLKIEAQDSFVYKLNENQYEQLRERVTSYTVKEHFNSLFNIENFRYILFPGNSSILWTASPTTKEQLRSVLRLSKSSSITFSWQLRRSEGSTADQVVLGSYTTKLNSETIELFIQNLDTSGSQPVPILLKELYPTIVYAPNSGRSVEFRELSQYIPNSMFNCNASLSSAIAYTLPESSDEVIETGIPANGTAIGTIISQWWSLKPSMNGSSFLKYGIQGHEDDLEMIVYSQRVSPAIFSYAASVGVVGLYVSVVLVIGKFIRSYVNELPQNIMTNQMLVPDRLLDLLDDIFTVRETGDLVMEEILVGKLYAIFRSSGRFVSLTDGRFKPKTN